VSVKQGKLIPLRRLAGDAAEMSDEALLAACAVGERAALGALFDRHHQAVFRFLGRLIAAERHALDDLVQNTFLEVWRSASRFASKGAARSWILGVGANVARHHVRGEARRRAAMQQIPAESAGGSGAGAARRPDDAAADRELVARLDVALAALPHDLAVAFVLCDLEDIPGVEAARALGVREGTMWRRLHDARKRLRAAIGEGR
jgi:RNA polymerase sigma factor (sigma-70 family)